MAECETRTDIFADLKIDIVVTKDGSEVANVRALRLPQFVLDRADAPPGDLKFAGRVNKVTEERTAAGRVDTGGYTGNISSTLKIEFQSDFYTDCAGPFCIKGKISDLKCEVEFEYDVFGPIDFTISEDTLTFGNLDFDDGCAPPEWRLCCSETDVELEWDIDEHQLTAEILLTLEGEATLDYEIWEKVNGKPAEKSSATYKKASLSDDGSLGFALVPGSIRVTSALPDSLGGGSVTTDQAEGFAVVRPGDVVGSRQELRVVALYVTSEAIKLPNGQSTGMNHCLLAPGVESRGAIDLGTGSFDLDVNSILFNDIFTLDAPVRVRCRAVGIYDFAEGEARLVTISIDEFPDDQIAVKPPKPRKKKGKKR